MDQSQDRLRANVLDFVRASLDHFADYDGANSHLVEMMQGEGEAFLANACDAQVRDIGQAPVARWLGPAIAHARNRSASRASQKIFTVMEQLSEMLPWELGYHDPSLSDAFRTNFGYAFIVGPGALIECDSFAAGVTMMGPNIFYNWHHHPAHEFYINLSQNSAWGLGFDKVSERKFEELIVIPGGTEHAMQSGSQPFIAPWLWIGDIHTPSQFSKNLDAK